MEVVEAHELYDVIRIDAISAEPKPVFKRATDQQRRKLV